MYSADQSGVSVSIIWVEVNLVSLTCCGYYQIVNIGVSLSLLHFRILILCKTSQKQDDLCLLFVCLQTSPPNKQHCSVNIPNRCHNWHSVSQLKWKVYTEIHFVSNGNDDNRSNRRRTCLLKHGYVFAVALPGDHSGPPDQAG